MPDIRAGLDDLYAAFAQDFQIRLGRRMLPHIHVHRRSNNDRSGGREIKRGEKIVGDALREFGQNVGGCGSHDQCVDRLRNRNMFDRRVDVGLFRAGTRINPVMTFSPESAAKVRGEQTPGRRGS